MFPRKLFLIVPLHSAIVWGASAKHSRGQKVGLDHVLEDEDGDFPPNRSIKPEYGTLTILMLLTSCPYLKEIVTHSRITSDISMAIAHANGVRSMYRFIIQMYHQHLLDLTQLPLIRRLLVKVNKS